MARSLKVAAHAASPLVWPRAPSSAYILHTHRPKRASAALTILAMSSQYECLRPDTLYRDIFDVDAPSDPALGPQVWPRRPGVFIRNTPAPNPVEGAEQPQPPSQPGALGRELVVGQFGLVPPWVKSASDAKLRSSKLVNARAETASTSTNFRGAWLGAQRCIVPMAAFHIEDWRSGKALPTRVARVDGKPMGAAGLWERWSGAQGEVIVSFCLLTVNANSHALMHRYGQPGSEKRMPAILNEGAYGAWLNTPEPEKAREFMRAYPAEALTANPIEKKR
jgi:putative SOS response-associated peptidase YedK